MPCIKLEVGGQLPELTLLDQVAALPCKVAALPCQRDTGAAFREPGMLHASAILTCPPSGPSQNNVTPLMWVPGKMVLYACSVILKCFT